MTLFDSSFHQWYVEEEKKLVAMKKETQKVLNNAIPGDLRIHHRQGRTSFGIYMPSEKGRGKEVYMPVSDPLLPVYVEKYCAKKMKAVICRCLDELRKAPDKYHGSVIQEMLEEFCRDLGEWLPDSFRANTEQIKNWSEKHFPRNPFKKEKAVFKTEKGDYVRSKIECICADIMYEIPLYYQYEKSTALRSRKTVYPDFTIWSHVNGRIYYLEVCGKMHDTEYRKDLFDRINIMAESGIVQGKNLMLTFDSEDVPFSRDGFVEMLRQTVLAPRWKL